MNIAFFDFDGTITTKDSMIDFIIYAVGYKKFLAGMIMLSPYLIIYKLGIIKNYLAKEKVVTQFFGGWDSSLFDKRACEYSEKIIPRIIRDRAKEALDFHRVKGDLVVVVSASCEKWIKPWCDANGLDLIGTVLDVDNGIITGKLSGGNCYGEEKAKRIKQKYNLTDFKNIYAYGDSAGDIEMLNLANIRYYKWRQI